MITNNARTSTLVRALLTQTRTTWYTYRLEISERTTGHIHTVYHRLELHASPLSLVIHDLCLSTSSCSAGMMCVRRLVLVSRFAENATKFNVMLMADQRLIDPE